MVPPGFSSGKGMSSPPSGCRSTCAEAADMVRELLPFHAIQMQYGGSRAAAACGQGSVEHFLQAMAGTNVRRGGSSLSLVPPLGGNAVKELMR